MGFCAAPDIFNWMEVLSLLRQISSVWAKVSFCSSSIFSLTNLCLIPVTILPRSIMNPVNKSRNYRFDTKCVMPWRIARSFLRPSYATTEDKTFVSFVCLSDAKFFKLCYDRIQPVSVFSFGEMHEIKYFHCILTNDG